MKTKSKYEQCKDLFCEINNALDNFDKKINDNSQLTLFKKNVFTGLRSNALAIIPKKVWLVFIMLILISNGCSKSQPNIENFTISKGSHYTFHANKVIGNSLKYDILFSESCIYDLGNSNQYDINKLFGFNACNSLHHENSARFGWLYMDGQIEIYAYVYENSARYSEQIASVNINEWNTFELTNTGGSYVFKVNGILFIYDKENPCVSKYNYQLYPYFGGDEVAPHDITIQFKSE